MSQRGRSDRKRAERGQKEREQRASLREGQRERAPWCGLSPLFIELSHITRSKLVEGKLNKSGKNFDKVSGLLFF